MGPSTAQSLVLDFISKVIFPSRQIDQDLVKMPGRSYKLIAQVGRKDLISGGNHQICCIDTINDAVCIYFLWSFPILLLLAESFPTASCCMLILHLKVWMLYLSVSTNFSQSNLKMGFLIAQMNKKCYDMNQGFYQFKAKSPWNMNHGFL